MESTLRPIRPDERALLEERTRPAVLDRTQANLGALLISLPVWFALLSADALLLPRNGMIEVAYIFGMLIVTYPMCFQFYNHRDLERIRASHVYAARLREEYRTIEMVEDWRVQVLDAIEVFISEDSGLHYYLQLEDGRVLVLGDEWFECDDDDDPYAPNREIIVRRLLEPRQGDVIGVQCLGTYFAPSYRRALTAEEWDAGAIPNDGDILPGPLSRYKDRTVPNQP